MTIQLRPYQQRVVDSIRGALNAGMKTPCASVATGGGKTWILTTMADTFVRKNKRCLALTHVKELIGQLDAAASQMLYDHGVYAVSLNRRETNKMYIIAQIQSCYKRMSDFGPFDVVFIDECHLWSGEEDGMFQKAVDHLRTMNPNVRIVGLSATPFRMKEGLVYGPGKMFEACVEHVTMRELIEAGFLTPLVGKNMAQGLDLSGVHMRGGDFIQSELAEFMEDQAKVNAAVADMLVQCRDRNRVLVFSSGNKHSQMIVDQLRSRGESAEWVSGEHNATERDNILAESRAGAIKYLVNCAVLTTGYDDPAIDAIAMLRPTRSPGLLLQCAGRGLRLHPSKRTCLFLDFGKCIETLGPLDTIENNVRAKRSAKDLGAAPTKTCPQCANVLHASKMSCDCGYVWTKKLNHDEQASHAQVMSGLQTVPVQRTSYSVQPSKKETGQALLRVTYWSSPFEEIAREFISVDQRAGEYALRRGMMWLRDTPRIKDSPYSIDIISGYLVCKHNGKEISAPDAVSLLPYTKCLQSPKAVTVAPDVERPRFMKVWRREFE